MTTAALYNRDLIVHDLQILKHCGGLPSKFYSDVANTVLLGFQRAKMLMFRRALKISVSEAREIIYYHPMLIENKDKDKNIDKDFNFKNNCSLEEQEKLEHIGKVIGAGSEGSVRPVYYESATKTDSVNIVLKKSQIGLFCLPRKTRDKIKKKDKKDRKKKEKEKEKKKKENNDFDVNDDDDDVNDDDDDDDVNDDNGQFKT